jgi:hypothetical protein
MEDRLQTFHVGPRTGQVQKLTQNVHTWSVTVECEDIRSAFHFSIPAESRIRNHDYIQFRGITRLNPGFKRNGKPIEANLIYYHQPDWLYFELQVQGWERVASPETTRALKCVVSDANALLNGWDNTPTEDLDLIVQRLDAAAQLLRTNINTRRAAETEDKAPIRYLDLNLDLTVL